MELFPYRRLLGWSALVGCGLAIALAALLFLGPAMSFHDWPARVVRPAVGASELPAAAASVNAHAPALQVAPPGRRLVAPAPRVRAVVAAVVPSEHRAPRVAPQRHARTQAPAVTEPAVVPPAPVPAPAEAPPGPVVAQPVSAPIAPNRRGNEHAYGRGPGAGSRGQGHGGGPVKAVVAAPTGSPPVQHAQHGNGHGRGDGAGHGGPGHGEGHGHGHGGG